MLAPGDDGPLAVLGSGARDSDEFAQLLLHGDAASDGIPHGPRDQRDVAGLGRGYTDDVLNRVGTSPITQLAVAGARQQDGLVER